MKGFINNGDFKKSSTFLQISGLIFISLTFFYLGKHWSDVSHQLIFFNSRQTQLSSSKTPSPITLSLNLNKTFDLNSLIYNTTQTQPLFDLTLPLIPPTSHPKPLPPLPQERLMIVDENGTMADDFEVRDFDPGVMDNWGSDFSLFLFFFRHLNTLDGPLVRAKWMNTKKALTKEAKVVKQLDADLSF
ncbi:hypothetical protein CsSME_00022438 [Camellia sinensis var. sinensis]